MSTLRTSFWENLLRKKTLTADLMKTDLQKCLTLSDLTFMAIGSMVGSGLYVLTGTIARDVAGPSVIISYIIAAIASCLSAISYAEFGARIPITGSAYQFTYLSIGEFWAFIIGWNVLIEHVVSGAAVAKAFSGYVDGLTNNVVRKYLIKHAPMIGGGLVAKYPDLLAVAILIVATIILATGAKLSSKVTAGFAGLNLLVVVFVMGTGFYLGDLKNWTEVKGGFFPYEFSGTIAGAATLIFSYVGYEVLASATEEAINPNRDIPLSLLIAMSTVVLAYVGASSALTLMVPYNLISVLSPFPDAYIEYGWNWARFVELHHFGNYERLVDTEETNEVSSNGRVVETDRSRLTETSVISEMEIETNDASYASPKSETTKSNTTDEDFWLNSEHVVGTVKTEVLSSRFGYIFQPLTRYEAGSVPSYLLIISTFAVAIVVAFCLFTHEYISSWWSILIISIFSLIAVVSLLLLLIFNQDKTIKTFTVPAVPFLPFVSVIINIVLILKLQPMTWIRLGIWCTIGLIIYFCYGYRNSAERKNE
uniref:cationic amino acid transporter 4-like isoform X2 n=1 Tax=Styela clava TaxID=7725 RepID=UPI00193A151B|nr:cationic amino acid transporter 4-like isoform X2 [Styela clava]